MSGKKGHFPCSFCDKVFSNGSNKRRHERVTHDISFSPKSSFKCSECSDDLCSKAMYLTHMKVKHPSINLKTIDLIFTSEQDFRTWKQQIEKKTLSSFICRQKFRTSTALCNVFPCHRSGSFRSRGNGVRKVKVKGSIKVGSYCPAEIRQEICDTANNSTVIKVRYMPTHVGHECDLERLTLTKSEKDVIAGHLFNGLPIPKVLKNISKNVREGSRLSLINPQDIRNVMVSYDINNVHHSSDDLVFVDAWVRKLTKKNSPILVYKLPGEENEDYPELDTDDFMLGIMNDTQEYFFKTYGDEAISVEYTQGENKFNIQLLSVIVKTRDWDSFPVAFLWSNSKIDTVFQYFFQSMKERLNRTLSVKTFLSDDLPIIYNAWYSVFGPCKQHLLCEWHVKQAWVKNVSSGCNKIVDQKQRESVLESLNTIFKESDKHTFHKLLQEKITELSSDQTTSTFALYFQSHFANRVEKWAACYRQNPEISTEDWHLEMKYDPDLKYKRFNKAIFRLFEFLKLKFIDALCNLHEQKLADKVVTLNKTHNSVFDSKPGFEITKSKENEYLVSSLTKIDEVYIVKGLQVETKHTCKVRCDSCGVCMHQLQCSCPDATISFNFCKHMHLFPIDQSNVDCTISEKETSDVESHNEEQQFDDKNINIRSKGVKYID